MSSLGHRPGHALDVEVSEGDVYALVVHAVEQIVTLGVARIEAGVVGRRERPVGTQLTAVDKPARCQTDHTHTQAPHALAKGNESVPIQLTLCCIPEPAIFNAKLKIYFSNGSNFIKQH